MGIPVLREVSPSSVFGTRVSNGRIICPAHPLLRLQNWLPPLLWSALFGCGIHHRTISPICGSGSGKLILQCMAARASRRSLTRRILVGETTVGKFLLLMIRMSQRPKREVRNQRGFGGVLGTFSPRKKYPVGGRHRLSLRCCSTAASRHGQSGLTQKQGSDKLPFAVHPQRRKPPKDRL